MKIFAFICITALSFLFIQNTEAQNKYDSVLAKKLQADDYGMKNYVFVILKKGSANISDKHQLDSIFHGHMANIQRLAAEGKLIIAGPIGDNDKNYEGIFVFNTSSVDEARQWLNTDPAIQAKDLDAELYPWYCSAALQEIPALHKQVQKKSF
ncbi:MAG: hypothetical protein JO072_13285 [Parafilimonas sp.]|nr:hypothetical protein [Parafilimonas sp.]